MSIQPIQYIETSPNRYNFEYQNMC